MTPPSLAARATSLFDALPGKPLKDALVSTIDRLQGGTVPPPPPIDHTKPHRLLVGPVNYAGQGWQWARALERLPSASAVNFVTAENNPYHYPVDASVRWRTFEYSRAWQRDILTSVGVDYTHVLIEACFPVLGGMDGGDVLRQADRMRQRGASIAIVGHGTDIRLPSRHAQLEPWSFLGDHEWTHVERLEQQVSKNLQLINDLKAPTFVSTAGLLLDVPHATVLPIIIDLERWAGTTPLLHRARPKLVHAPTNAIVKGTHLVAPVLERLHDEGVIEYVPLQGVPNVEMPDRIRDADIVLDQLRIGDYGVAATEALATGRIVLAHLSDQVRSVMSTMAGMPVPIVETTPDTIESVIRAIVADRDAARLLASAGPEYVRAVHDGRQSAAVLHEWVAR